MGTSGADAIACAIKAKEITFTSVEHPMEWEIQEEFNVLHWFQLCQPQLF